MFLLKYVTIIHINPRTLLQGVFYSWVILEIKFYFQFNGIHNQL